MATLTHPIVWLAIVPLVGCGELRGFGGAAPPLASLHVEVTGDFEAVELPGSDSHSLRVALVWGEQWLPEPLCILPPDDPDVAQLIATGCRDPLGFVPSRVAATAPIEPGVPTALDLFELPAADVMVGDLSARVAYGSMVIYDDRNGDRTLDFDRARRLRGADDNGPPPMDEFVTSQDVVYGASFVRMTEPDTRVAFREGGFDAQAAFYPRVGCGAPPPSFSLVSAGGFSQADALAALARGELPAEDPAQCSETAADQLIAIAFRTPSEVHEVACEERRTDSSARYRKPPDDMPDFSGRTTACAKIPDFDSGKAGAAMQLVISGQQQDHCAGLSHFVLRGCSEDALCALPEWDLTANPPAWWPCSAQVTE
jgi:hypothetical protein